MTITVGITHHTEYHYDKAINMGPHVFRLRPAPHCRTPIKSYSLKIFPENHYINWQQDPFGNYLGRVVFPEKTSKFWFTVDVVAELAVINPFDFFVEEYADNYPFAYEKRLKQDLLPYLETETKTPSSEMKKLIAEQKKNQGMVIVDFLVAVNQQIYQMVKYGIRLEQGVQSATETLKKKSGSCRDSAWLLVQLFRHLGLAARFVSGYLVQLTSDEKSLDGPSGPEQDFTDLHAWCEVYIPGAGWIGLDATSGLFAGEGHIPLACTPEPSSAAPVSGGVDKCETEFSFSNKVRRLIETPRVTKPYSDIEWAAINNLGQQVDKDLKAQKIHLTMGGEPTFISIDDMESEQWSIAADGEDKRRLAHNLFMSMEDKFTENGFRHYGQGKWYPGEPLPRWQYAVYWRKDGVALWKDQSLLANINDKTDFTTEDAKRFTDAFAQKLKIPEDCVVTGFEDVLYHLWQEGNLPLETSPDAPELLDAMSRKTFLAKMEHGIEKPVGYIIPIQWGDNNCWNTSEWHFKRGNCFLLPGDSPMGYRLPLSSIGLPPNLIDRDPNAIPKTFGRIKNANVTVNQDPVKTAISFECRGGKLYVFMPPVTDFEHYLTLLRAIEYAAKASSIPVVLEGYTPPYDSRVEKFAVTPDPGVIEVNVHPVDNWAQLVKNTTALYALAKENRLIAEKFMLDGRHTGTGGGNHVTMGGKTPSQSPFIRRPDVLRSFITFWQHHPGLSYLFSSMFIGPTSQAPRVDEARDELLYELEIAFSQMPTGEVPQPWLVDRLLRNLLVDLTGNTHRAEFCIDKLYSPDSATGRLGLVEFRGFEMPPHSRMSLMQMLLLRTLLAWFWKQPYHKPLVRWNTELHDKFLLPHFVKEDIGEICRDLQRAGYNIKADWFEPFFEFRFPQCGVREIEQIQLELRAAIEPWHVMGEESTSSGTARYVDSSLERVQVKVTNMPNNRYLIACNGRRIPLKQTRTKGEFVAGIRFRAWQPPSALHPTIGVHAPLVIDVFDTWSGRSVGGFTYHVSHPGGRNPETFPVNAFEAEGRRIARFWDHGHTPAIKEEDAPVASHEQVQHRFVEHDGDNDFVIPDEEPLNKDYPNTLDLRRKPLV
ncbi:transglutaminase family protein [Paraglaciecola aquimarina]|uniref:Transglutaminase family protein n=1 Tax=Paraglaciecola algarum TaxID=3050085 RepID=A0ABS9D804_9ALTE|nr:transglutaminase family protein [Paraglaciecola sp. G1-23]MCF2948925.1 transglutaminase family protein [Paraglaciecola sp. G1-23]